MPLLAHADTADFLVRTHGSAFMTNTGWLTALGTDEHRIGNLQRHGLFDHATLSGLALWANMLFNGVQALNNYFVVLWHCPRDRALFPSIFAGNNQDGVALLDIHLGKMQWFFLFLLYCHFLPR